jgi:hypothetical protein
LNSSYGPQNYDYKFLFNLSMYYQPPVFRGQKGVLGHVLGGWTVSPLFTAQSGGGVAVGYSEGSGSGYQGFGEVSTGSGTLGSNFATSEDAVGFKPYTGTNSVKYNIYGSAGSNIWQGNQSVGTKTAGTYGLNMFSDPAAVYSEFRPCVLGYDTSCGGYANLRGLPTWNMDVSLIKDIGVYKERVGATFFVQVTNVLNHFQPSSPSLSLTGPTTFGQITGQANTPRNMEFGIRVRF